MTRYRALVELTVPVDEKEASRLFKLTAEGVTDIPDRKMKTVTAGTIAEYIPAKSIPWLLEQGYIEKVEEAG